MNVRSNEPLTIGALRSLIADLPDDQPVAVMTPKGPVYLGTVDVYCATPYGMKSQALVFRP